MRILFERASYKNTTCYYGKMSEKFFSRWESLGKTDEKKLMKLLRQNFSSIKVWSRWWPPSELNQNYKYFWFTDPADEAFFLIWSNDGVEI